MIRCHTASKAGKSLTFTPIEAQEIVVKNHDTGQIATLQRNDDGQWWVRVNGRVDAVCSSQEEALLFVRTGKVDY